MAWLQTDIFLTIILGSEGLRTDILGDISTPSLYDRNTFSIYSKCETVKRGVADNSFPRELTYCVFPTLKGHIISLQKSYIIKARAPACLLFLIMTEPYGHEVYSISLRLSCKTRTITSHGPLSHSTSSVYISLRDTRLMRIITATALKWTPRVLFVL